MNPYSSSHAKPAHESSARTRNRVIPVVAAGAGAIAAMMVYVGDAYRWAHFNRRSGYLGTELIRDLLYAINDPFAIHIVAALWFVYAGIAAGSVTYLCRFLVANR
jgi:hypothetical protein